MTYKPVYNSIIPPDSTIALGDVHGQYDLFVQFLDWVKGSGARVIMLGDLIDRSKNPGDDLRVLNRVRDLMQDPEQWGLASFTSVMANHECMLVNCADGYGCSDWVRNGGDWENFEALKEHVDWIRELPYYVTVGDTLFSHAGCFPGVNPEESMHSYMGREEFVWQRGAFLRKGPGFDRWSKTLKKCVFGHTPRGPEPYEVPNGVCIDTGAYHTGILTAHNVTDGAFWRFTDERGRV
jgi:serine/threonine protein phosphatase 1